tara:strand:+ start:2031 stop:2324 length:294 start_codon:yes stop_codon:yes gene_type:complete
MSEKKKKLKNIASKGAKAGGVKDNTFYRESGDVSTSKEINNVKSIVYRGTAYNQNQRTADQWADLLRRSGQVDAGGHFKYKGKVYLSGGGTASKVRI